MVFKYAGGDRMSIEDEPLADPDHLLEGVRLAFDPFLPYAQ
jgi:hypothetical protein